MRLVYTRRIYTRNFVTDFLERLKNIVGGRLKQYEKMMDKAIGETNKEFNEKYPGAMNLHMDTEAFMDGGLMVTITGEIR